MTALWSSAREQHLRGRAMGTDVHIVLVPSSTTDPGLIDSAFSTLNELERRWSRFEPASEISTMNRQPDAFHLVSSETGLLVERSVQAWGLTSGFFDPTVLPNLAAVGYDRRFNDIAGAALCGSGTETPPGCAEIRVDWLADDEAVVRLGPGVGFDPGGLGKGLAADLLVEHLLAAGAAGAMVNIGGDLVCAGDAPSTAGWLINVNEPLAAADPLGLLALSSGAVATSTTLKRCWSTPSGQRHHVVDPRTGDSSSDGYVLASVVADAGWRAEALATQLLVSGDLACLDPSTVGAVVVDRDGGITQFGLFEEMAQ